MDCPWTASDKLNSDAKTEILLLIKMEYSGKRSTSDVSFWFLTEALLCVICRSEQLAWVRGPSSYRLALLNHRRNTKAEGLGLHTGEWWGTAELDFMPQILQLLSGSQAALVTFFTQCDMRSLMCGKMPVVNQRETWRSKQTKYFLGILGLSNFQGKEHFDELAANHKYRLQFLASKTSRCKLKKNGVGRACHWEATSQCQVLKTH